MLVASRTVGYIGFVLLTPAISWAEGAVRNLDCAIVKVCDSAGSCSAGSGRVTFSMAPVSVAADGSGKFEIRYGTVRASMAAQSEIGPFRWVVGQEQNTLLVSSESELLWHQASLGTTAAASIRFLSCRGS